MIAIGCDHGGYELKKEIEAYLDSRGLEYRDYGCDSTDSVDYPIYARKVAHAIVDGECEKGILICGTVRRFRRRQIIICFRLLSERKIRMEYHR